MFNTSGMLSSDWKPVGYQCLNFLRTYQSWYSLIVCEQFLNLGGGNDCETVRAHVGEKNNTSNNTWPV
jgi:hypothetical protein